MKAYGYNALNSIAVSPCKVARALDGNCSRDGGGRPPLELWRRSKGILRGRGPPGNWISEEKFNWAVVKLLSRRKSITPPT